MTRILLVCMANVCRSPMAYSVARQLAREAGLAGLLKFDSAGTHSPTTGRRMDARANAALMSRGYAPEKTRSKRIGEQDFERFDLILAMDSGNLEALQRQCPPSHQHKLRLLLSYAPETGATEVPDPYYGDTAGFMRVLDLCEAALRGLMAKLA
ncbi:MAG: phosphotyrosine protein phosphatase [Comamonadaceae bacterium CG_4_9_14_3_um_filter_60_33]|nr:MAG: phosphotyrosine protein phosphatase [Comamonadaceae bacterium CG_4_10_14_3_um_filter_60_42]PJB41539.1 MAG: phosphotyrosine protein phosphatase [Comamonadaceae bacterium CG_4_9_14_3_um_filter_60_33]